MQLIQEFISYIETEKRYSQHTLIAYQKDLTQFTDEFDIDDLKQLQEVTNKHLRNYTVELMDQGLENSSINRKISCLKSFFKYLKKLDYIQKNPAHLLKSLKTKKRLPQFVPESQLWSKDIFEVEKNEKDQIEIELIFELFYQTGIRLSELINLKRSKITSNQIKVLGKRNKERLIPITPKLSQLINNHTNSLGEKQLNSDLLFSDKNGKIRNPKFVYKKVNYYLGLATDLKKRSPHVLRHTFATHMLNNGASIESIKTLLGHTDLAATQVYTHNSFKQLKSVYNQSHPRGT
ncbi:MAG: tyrosine-type recombinase/integrase [Crocinitomicaceae bacterium]|nr:tyrosine-type recombinase/integrase [Crocinitomicaceae bacterium]